MAGGGLDPLTGYRNGRNGSDTDDAGVDGQSPHVPDRIERAGEGAAPEGLAISRELLSAVAGRIAGSCFMPPFDRCGIVSETLGCLSLPGPPHRRVGARPRGPVG